MPPPRETNAAVLTPQVRAATETVAVVGLGYVGLPVAALARLRGFSVIGYDIQAEKVAAIGRGEISRTDPLVREAFSAQPLAATADARRLAEADVVIVAVPTPVDEAAQPDLRALRSAIETVAQHAKHGVLLSIESTVNPGVCEEVIVPFLKSLGRDPDTSDLFLVHCPERVNPGDERWTIRNIPRVLGGTTPEARERGLAFYRRLVEAEVRPMSSIRAAEAVKVVENAFRDVNIAFVNELAQSFDRIGIDVTEVIHGASSKPFAFLAHYPGCGVGGHCIPVVPYHLIDYASTHGFDHTFLKLARGINDSMPRYTVERLKQAIGRWRRREGVRGVRVTLLGLSYKKDIGDLRVSPALKIEELLRAEGANLVTFDPFVPERSTARTLQAALRHAEAVVLATEHSLFQKLMPPDLQGTPVRVIVDGRNCLDHPAFREAGYTILGIGK